MNALKTDLKTKFKNNLKKSLGHLEYSFQKVQKLSLNIANANEETLEVFESFSSRFSRASDIFISHYLKILVLEQDPGFRGTLIDLLNFGEKASLIESAKDWLRIRELRNIAAHEYTDDDLQELYGELIALTPLVLKTARLLT